jgi:hypothetical protein
VERLAGMTTRGDGQLHVGEGGRVAFPTDKGKQLEWLEGGPRKGSEVGWTRAPEHPAFRVCKSHRAQVDAFGG